MIDPITSDPFLLPRVSRVRTRHREMPPRWASILAQLAFAALLALACAGPLMTIQGDAGSIREASYTAVLLLALVAMRPWRYPERLLVVPWPLLVALAWCWLSLLWAIDPGVGLRRLLLTTIVLWSLFALVREVGLDRSVMIMRVVLTLLLVTNIAVALVRPDIGIHPASDYGLAGDWRGIMGQKNWAGMASALTVLLFTFDATRVPLPIRIGVTIIAAIFLVLTDSATSMGMGIAALLVGGLFAWRAAVAPLRPLAPPAWGWALIGLGAAFCLALAVDPTPFLGLISNPEGFTGRNQIWTALVRSYVDRPLLGVGYGSFWDLGPNGPISVYANGWVTGLSQGHSGYLDLLVQIGAPGLLLVMLATLIWPLQRLLRGGGEPARVLAAAMLVFCLGHNFTETTLFDRDGLGQVFIMIAIALLWGTTAAPAHGHAARAKSSTHVRRRRRSSSSRAPSTE